MTPATDLSSVGVLPDHVRAWASALSSSAGVSFEFALFTLLSAMASATCGLKVVKRPDGGSEPTSLIVFAQAPPAYGKTRLYKRAFKAHHAVDTRRLAAFLDSNGINTPMTRGQSEAKEIDANQRCRLTSLQDCSKSGLLEALSGVGEAVSMSAHEGNLILNSSLFRSGDLEMVTTLWDGDGVVQTKRQGKLLIAMNATLNMLVMVQSDVFHDYRKRHGKQGLSIGFFGRSLWVCAQAWDGYAPCTVQVNDDCLLRYDAKVEELLARKCEMSAGISPTANDEVETPLEAENAAPRGAGAHREPEVMELDVEAARLYFDLDRQLKCRWSAASFRQDAVGRAMQNVLRLAALMQAFDDDRVPISGQVLHSAYQIVEYSLGQFSCVFPPEPVMINQIRPIKLSTQKRMAQRTHEDGQTVLGVIFSLCQRRKEEAVPLSDVRDRCAIYALRFRTALAMLVDEGRVELTGSGREKWVSVASPNDVRVDTPSLDGYRL